MGTISFPKNVFRFAAVQLSGAFHPLLGVNSIAGVRAWAGAVPVQSGDEHPAAVERP
jgi:hypothetical protein